jgi:hypothetical protein
MVMAQMMPPLVLILKRGTGQTEHIHEGFIDNADIGMEEHDPCHGPEKKARYKRG